MANSKTIGEIPQAQVLAALERRGETVLMPFGDNQRYDFVLDQGGLFLRVQVKTGRLKDGVITFPTSNLVTASRRVRRSYRGQVDVFAVYCPELHSIYVLPVDDCPEVEASLRVDPPRNRQGRGIRLAADYLLAADSKPIQGRLTSMNSNL